MAAGDPGSPARYYSSTAVETALSGSIPAQAQGAANTSFIVASVSGFPSSYPYTLIVDPDTSKEEVVTVTAGSGTTLSVTRGSDNTQGVAHSAGAVVRHGVSGREFRESETHIAARGYDIDQTILDLANQTHVHGIVTGEGVVVGTLKAQTLTQKTLTSPIISNPTLTGTPGLDASIVFEGATPDAFETTLTVVDPTQDNTITLPNTTGTVVIATAVQTLTNKTIDMTGKTITGLSSAGMVASSATPKDYVDAILGSATAAATSAASAATSATSAATSATSAAASATASASSASASATSATAAATSATSAAASATAAATSATSAAASATAAATSATSAAASATTAAASVATIAGYATASANSASAAATSATSAAASATAAATSASSAATSASSAATTYDDFDDRYLGSKASAPTVDNDGNTLLVGAIYWNSTLNNMYVWSGTVWVQIATTSVYSAPTLGSTTIDSGTTYTNVNGLTINSTTIPTSKTLVATDTTDFVATAGGSTITVASGTTVPLTIQNNGTGNSFVVNDVASDTTPFVIDATGNVAIGGTSAGSTYGATINTKLYVNNQSTDITPDSNWSGQITAKGSGYAGGIALDSTGLWLGNNSASRAIIFATNYAEKMRIDSSGNVAIGTTSIGGKFNVTGAAAGVAAYFTDATNSSLAIATLSGGVTLGTDGGGNLHFATDGATAAKRRMSIDAAGNIFIGTNTTPGTNTGGLTIQGKDIELMNIMGAY
jgi:hypothetical protein